ncbi:MAG TPA: GNAT family N-acetyltransferase [Candidatus Acidoferrum sp.]|nr:GNAT family N-acetyltransferase [Candidatus Acidoferrum sp.]
MSSVEFREAIPGDEAALLPMMRVLAQQDPEVIPFNESSVRAAFHQFLSLPAFGRIWLLYDGPTLIGYIVLAIGFSFEFRGHDAFIDELYIVPAYRRRGFGRQAMSFVEREARKLGVNAIHLEVDPGNDSALELYRRTGYVDHKRFLMTKWLKHDK